MRSWPPRTWWKLWSSITKWRSKITNGPPRIRRRIPTDNTGIPSHTFCHHFLKVRDWNQKITDNSNTGGSDGADFILNKKSKGSTRYHTSPTDPQESAGAYPLTIQEYLSTRSAIIFGTEIKKLLTTATLVVLTQPADFGENRRPHALPYFTNRSPRIRRRIPIDNTGIPNHTFCHHFRNQKITDNSNTGGPGTLFARD